MKTYSDVPISWWQLVKNSYADYWVLLRKAWPWFGLIFLSMMLLFAGFAIFKEVTSTFGAATPVSEKVLSGLGFFGYGLACSLIWTYIFISLYHYCHTLLSGQVASFKASFKQGKQRFLTAFFAGVLILFLFIILFIIAIPIGTILYHTNHRFLLVIGSILFVLFIIYLMILFYLVYPTVALTQCGVFASLKMSIRLVFGSWWRVAGAFVAVVIPFSILVGIVSAPIIIPLTTIHFPGQPIILMIVKSFIQQMFIVPIGVAVVLNLYHDLRLRKPRVGINDSATV